MNKKTRTLLCLMAIFGISTLLVVTPPQVTAGSSIDADTLRTMLTEFIDAWQFALEKNESEVMKEVWNNALHMKKQFEVSGVEDFDYRDTFNFTNSESVFGPLVMTEEEVSSNLRNYMFQLLYSDIEAACEVSILDIMLFRVFDSLIVDWIDWGFGGFCNGFAQACRDFFEDPNEIPLGFDYTKELPSPNPNQTIAEETGGDVVEAIIKDYVLWKGSGAFFNPNHLKNWLYIFLGIPTSQSGISNSIEVQKITENLLVTSPFFTPAVVLLMNPCWEGMEDGFGHFVNVYDYDVNSNGSITLYIYNNWDTWNSSWGKYDDWILVDSNGEFRGTHQEPDNSYSRLCYYAETSEYNTILTTLIELLPDLLSLGLLSPVDVAVTDPLGRTVSVDDDNNIEYGFPAVAFADSDGHKDMLIPFVPGLPYTINLTGTDVGEYTLQTHRYVDGRIITKEIVGHTEPGENDVYTVTLEGEGINLAKAGVVLHAPTILSGSAVELEWTEYNEPDFDHYEIYYSTSVNNIGVKYGADITDAETTSTIVSGLSGETTYFFTVRVVTDSGDYTDSNKVGAVLPEDYTMLLYIAAGVGGFAIFLLVIVVFRRRRSK